MLAGLELVTRSVLFRASKDLDRFRGFPARVMTLMAEPGPHVVCVGNSITEHAIDADALGAELSASVEVFTADSSHINTWTWMVRSLTWNRGLSPDVLVLTFHDASLEDGARLEVGRLAQFFTNHHDWPELFDHELTTLDERADLVVSSVWASYAVRDRIKERLFKLVPGYQAYTTFENAANRAIERSAKRVGDRPRSYRTLARLLELAREHHTRVVVVAFPTRTQYLVPAELPTLVQHAGASFVDLRSLPLDDAADYDDDLHLNERGRAIYTHRFAAELGMPGR